MPGAMIRNSRSDLALAHRLVFFVSFSPASFVARVLPAQVFVSQSCTNLSSRCMCCEAAGHVTREIRAELHSSLSRCSECCRQVDQKVFLRARTRCLARLIKQESRSQLRLTRETCCSTVSLGDQSHYLPRFELARWYRSAFPRSAPGFRCRTQVQGAEASGKVGSPELGL